MSRKMTTLDYVEGYAVRAVMFLFACLPLDTASAIGGRIGRLVGPMTGIHRKARKQIIEILGDKNVELILSGMWDNLGRTFAEYPHLAQIRTERITLDDRAHLDASTLEKQAAIFISGHFANWEVCAHAIVKTLGIMPDLVYRPPNNLMVARLLEKYRTLDGRIQAHPKSRLGIRGIISALSEGRKIGILIDQKYNEGVPVPFFGKPAMTSLAFAQLGQRFKCPVYPSHIVRTHGANFKVTIYPSMSLFDETGAPRNEQDIAEDANNMLEIWMREHPEQWLWVHQRWASKALTKSAEKLEELEPSD